MNILVLLKQNFISMVRIDGSVSLPTTETAEVYNAFTWTNLNEGINNAQLYLKDLATNEWLVC